METQIWPTRSTALPAPVAVLPFAAPIRVWLQKQRHRDSQWPLGKAGADTFHE